MDMKLALTQEKVPKKGGKSKKIQFRQEGVWDNDDDDDDDDDGGVGLSLMGIDGVFAAESSVNRGQQESVNRR